MIKSFPKELPKIRTQQSESLNFLTTAFQRSKYAVLELPVGGGKSGIGVAVARHFKSAVLITPRISLMRQYCEEFEDVAPLYGRANFECLELSATAHKTIPIILEGVMPPKPQLEVSCASAPCLNRPTSKQAKIKAQCDVNGGCPHGHSIDVAQRSEVIIANFHSFMYSISINQSISPRKVLILDECHNTTNLLRDFLKIKFRVRRKVLDSELTSLTTTERWCQWLLLPEQTARLTDQDSRDSWKSRLEKLIKLGNSVQNCWREAETGYLFVEFTPTNVGSAANAMIFNLFDHVLFMSGTIYSKDDFLKPLGINPDTVPYLRIASDFPKENRPVYLPKATAKDLSFKGWKINFKWILGEIREIINKYPNAKGIIHTNSYSAAKEIVEAMGEPRLMTHDAENFAKQLQKFYDTDEPRIFISPNVGEGYSFDEEYARFQIILTPKYEPASDAYVKYILDNNRWDLYNYSALKVFGQQLGRVVRSRVDTGDSYLIGSGFNNLIKKSWNKIPNWLKESFKEMK